MNKDIMRKTGFGDMVDEVVAGNCPICHKHIDHNTEFRDILSKREWAISGLCQKCQDDVFGGEK